MFTDRADAGRQLARALAGRLAPDALILAIPRGGVLVAAEVASALGLELDVVIVRKIGAPGNPEYAIGAIDEDGNVIGAPGSLADEAYVGRAAEEGRVEIARRVRGYRGDRPAPRITGREVALVDDGVATGFTLKAAVGSVRARGAQRVVVAAPVAAPPSAAEIREIAEEVIVLDEPQDFYAVGQFYRDFDQTTDAEVVRALAGVWAAE
jgi:putative phosphoribosyl transferase